MNKKKRKFSGWLIAIAVTLVYTILAVSLSYIIMPNPDIKVYYGSNEEEIKLYKDITEAQENANIQNTSAEFRVKLEKKFDLEVYCLSEEEWNKLEITKSGNEYVFIPVATESEVTYKVDLKLRSDKHAITVEKYFTVKN